jgi:hypothetical protein
MWIMKARAFLIIVALLLNITESAKTQDDAHHSDKELVRQVIQNYFEGLKTNDAEITGRVVHPKAKWFSILDKDKLYEVTRENRAKLIRGGIHENIRSSQGEMKISSIDVTGNNAYAKIEIEEQLLIITQYLLLLRFDSGWKIVSGTITGKEKPRK